MPNFNVVAHLVCPVCHRQTDRPTDILLKTVEYHSTRVAALRVSSVGRWQR